MSGNDSEFVTRCPACQRAFHVHTKQLQAADGQVRCGQCKAVFDAREHSTEQQLTFELVPERDDRAIRASALSLDFDDEQSPPFDSEALTALRDIDQPLDMPAGSGRGSPLRLAGAWVLAVLLTVALAGQFVWHESAQLAQNPVTRPWMQDLCQLTGCELQPYRNPAALRSGNFSLRSLPGQDDALLLTLSIHNDAALPQSLPGLDLAFTDPEDRIVAARRFLPSEYLDPELLTAWRQEHGEASLPELPAGGSVSVQMALADPGAEAVNYELAFSQL